MAAQRIARSWLVAHVHDIQLVTVPLYQTRLLLAGRSDEPKRSRLRPLLRGLSGRPLGSAGIAAGLSTTFDGASIGVHTLGGRVVSSHGRKRGRLGGSRVVAPTADDAPVTRVRGGTNAYGFRWPPWLAFARRGRETLDYARLRLRRGGAGCNAAGRSGRERIRDRAGVEARSGRGCGRHRICRVERA